MRVVHLSVFDHLFRNVLYARNAIEPFVIRSGEVGKNNNHNAICDVR